MSAPKISVITPCYNAEHYLKQMINSVISQTYVKWELIIVDDYSNDNSVKIIKEFTRSDTRIKLLKLKKRSGAAFARNIAIKVAKGRYLTFLDADDYWDNNFLKYSKKSIKGHSIIYSELNFVNSDGKFIRRMKIVPKVNYNGILKGTPISCISVFIDLEKIGKKFFPLNCHREDLAYWLLLLKTCHEAYGFRFCEANYRYRVGSSSNKIQMAIKTWQDYRNQHNISFLRSIYFFSYYGFNSFKKFFLFYLIKLFK